MVQFRGSRSNFGGYLSDFFKFEYWVTEFGNYSFLNTEFLWGFFKGLRNWLFSFLLYFLICGNRGLKVNVLVVISRNSSCLIVYFCLLTWEFRVWNVKSLVGGCQCQILNRNFKFWVTVFWSLILVGLFQISLNSIIR